MLHPAAVGPLLSSRGLPTIRDMDSGSLVAWVTVLLLAVNAVLVWMYLGETKKIRIANEAQLEAQLMPAVVVRHVGSQALQLVNVGKGPALHIKLSAADRGSLGARGQVSIADEIPYLEPGPLTTSIPVRTQGAGIGALNGRSLQCEYVGLSGRTYWTVADFDKFDNDRLIATRFRSENPLP
ncbi:MAG: hypothetical protein ACLPVW_09275 [Terriglobales bacterium]